MKKAYRIALLGFAATLFATGCGKDKIIFPETPDDGAEVGYLALAGMNLGVSAEIETLVSGSGSGAAKGDYDGTGGGPATATRTTEDADGSYKVAIRNNASQETTWEGTYADIKAMTAPMELQPGRYSVRAASPDAIRPVAWESPAYAGSTDFTIVKKATTSVSDLVCTLSNIKTTVELSADLKALFLNDGSDDLKTTVSLGGTSCVFAHDETRAAYFAAANASNTLTIVLTGKYNVKGEGETPEYQPITMTQKVQNVKAGQWRKIAISIEHADEGNVQFVITVETWVYDQQIDVDVMSELYAYGEEEIPDVDDETSHPDGPQVSLEGDHLITDPFRITASSFDFDFDPVRCNDLLSIIATPQGGATIADAYCVLDSDNAALLAALDAAGYADRKIPLYPDNGAANYAVIRTDNAGRLIVKVNDAGMYGLYGYAGTHTVKLVATDSENRRTYTPIVLSVVKGGGSETGPAIVGLDGYDIDTRYTITAADNPPLKVALDVTSATGITAFRIEIAGGEVLPDNELINLDLAPQMDLIHPASEAMESRLRELGFLPKDGSTIQGATAIRFDISEFIPAMTVLPGAGNCDFKLIVTDASGTTEKTLMFNVVH